MTKHSDKTFYYISPLKNCEEERAKQVANLIEASMLELIDLQIWIIQNYVSRAYDRTVKMIKSEEKKECNTDDD